ncbi:MAG: HD domain-containing protein [Elusimicrobiota bacterium]
MSIRKEIETKEKENLSIYAMSSSRSRGRDKYERSCTFRTEFQVDKDRILYSLGFRLLKYKTQVFPLHKGQGFRTRMTHTLEVVSISRKLARGLNLNQDLTEAIALGHDIGHPPFGHAGEAGIDEVTPFEYTHSTQGLRIVEFVENQGKGLNLTCEVKEGIQNHSKSSIDILSLIQRNKNDSISMEARVVQFADMIAYINHDIDDAIKMGFIKKYNIPNCVKEVFTLEIDKNIIKIIEDIVSSSKGKNYITMSSKTLKLLQEARKYLIENLYNLPLIKDEQHRVKRKIKELYNYLVNNYHLVVEKMDYLKNCNPHKGTCDFISYLTDEQAENLHNNYCLRK